MNGTDLTTKPQCCETPAGSSNKSTSVVMVTHSSYISSSKRLCIAYCHFCIIASRTLYTTLPLMGSQSSLQEHSSSILSSQQPFKIVRFRESERTLYLQDGTL